MDKPPPILLQKVPGGFFGDVVMEWQPIGTAPKDGTPILVWGKCTGEIRGEYRYQSAVVAEWSDLGEEWQMDTDTYGVSVDATHWMPIPEPPK
jgi:hypothetical protein